MRDSDQATVAHGGRVQRTGRRRLFGSPWAWIAALVILAVAAIAIAFVLRRDDRPAPIVIGFADSFTGPGAIAANSARNATELYFNEVNAAGGIDGHRLVLDQPYNDRGLPAKAVADAEGIVAGPALAVLGRSSRASIAVDKSYRDGRIASVTGNFSADGPPADSPYYFRALSPNSAQGGFLAEYIRTVLLRHTSAFFRAPDIDLVGSADPYSTSFLAGFRGRDGDARRTTVMLQADMEIDAAAKAAAEQLAQHPEPRIIVLGVAKDEAASLLKAIRRAGIRSMVILSSSAASDDFIAQFNTEPEERDEPGFFTENLFAVAPVILDNSGLLGQRLVIGYRSGTGKQPDWFAAGAADAARVLVEAIRRARIGNTEESKQADREKIRDALAAIDGPANSTPGITGPLYFDAERAMPRPMQFGYFHAGRFLSAPLQLVPVRDRDLVDIEGEIAQGHIVRLGDRFFWLQRVVSTGINLVQLDRVDIKEGTFRADFYLWLRYASGDDLPSHIGLADFNGIFDVAHPLRSSVEDGIEYRLWRINGTFKASFNLHDYPFDTQALVIRVQNRDYPSDQIVYAIDTFGLQADARNLDADAFKELQLWHVVNVAPFVTASSIQSALGQPALFGTPNRTEYGGFALAVLVKRNVATFMVKALLPLFLLVLVVFTTMFFPPSMAKERLTIPVTGILTGSVLLISINNQLPPLGYTTSLEYLFYSFFLLCLMAMIVGLFSEIMRDRKFHNHVIKFDVFGRIAYICIVLLTTGLYLWKYSARF